MLNKGKLYCQIDDVTMGSPLGPTLANFFQELLENQFMTNHLFSQNSKNENNRCITLPYERNAFLVFKKLVSPNLKE